jgi:hypothetical protein
MLKGCPALFSDSPNVRQTRWRQPRRFSLIHKELFPFSGAPVETSVLPVIRQMTLEALILSDFA